MARRLHFRHGLYLSKIACRTSAMRASRRLQATLCKNTNTVHHYYFLNCVAPVRHDGRVRTDSVLLPLPASRKRGSFGCGIAFGNFFESLRHNRLPHSLRSGVATHTPSNHALGLRSCLFLSSIIELQAPGNRRRRSCPSGSRRCERHNASRKPNRTNRPREPRGTSHLRRQLG